MTGLGKDRERQKKLWDFSEKAVQKTGEVNRT